MCFDGWWFQFMINKYKNVLFFRWTRLARNKGMLFLTDGFIFLTDGFGAADFSRFRSHLAARRESFYLYIFSVLWKSSIQNVGTLKNISSTKI